MFTYNVYREASNSEFIKACKRIEAIIAGIKRKPILIDVDGTTIQLYDYEGKEIKVMNDYEVDAVYVDSEIDLNRIFA